MILADYCVTPNEAREAIGLSCLYADDAVCVVEPIASAIDSYGARVEFDHVDRKICVYPEKERGPFTPDEEDEIYHFYKNVLDVPYDICFPDPVKPQKKQDSPVVICDILRDAIDSAERLNSIAKRD